MIPVYAYFNVQFADEFLCNGEVSSPATESFAAADGVLLDMGLDGRDIDKSGPFVECAKSLGKDIILLHPMNPKNPDEKILDRLLGISRRLELGDTRGGEFGGGIEAAIEYRKLSFCRGFDWICGLTPWALFRDYQTRGGLCRYLAETETLAISHTAYVIAGDLFNRPDWPDMGATSMSGLNLRGQFGLTVESVRHFIKDMNIWSAVGRQAGLDLGIHRYMRQLGFNGFIVGIPFVLPEDIRE